MRKNVNNDVSKDSPIQACVAHQSGDHEFPCYPTYLLQIVQTIYNYFYSLVWHSKSSRSGFLYTTCGIPSLSFRNCKAKCSGRGWTTMASRDRLMKPVCHSKATTIVYWIVTRYNIDYAVYKAQSQNNHFPVFFIIWVLKTKKELNNLYVLKKHEKTADFSRRHHFHHCRFLVKWRVRREFENSILMTCHCADLGR